MKNDDWRARAIQAANEGEDRYRVEVLGQQPIGRLVARESAPPVNDLAVLRDFRASEQRVVDEQGPISVRIIRGDSAQDIFDMSAPPDETSIAALAVIIRDDPIRAATRWLTLEGQVRLQRAHLEAIELRMLAGRNTE